MRSATELVVLGIVDLLMTSVFCVGLLSDRESIEKMSELNSRSSQRHETREAAAGGLLIGWVCSPLLLSLLGWLSVGWLRTGGGTTDYSSIEERGTVGAGGSKFSGAHA